MANPTYLMKRNGIYYARIPVPKMLQAELGRKELWKSLGNRSYKEACKLLKAALLSETLLMAHSKDESEILRNKAAMVAIGQRQHELSRQFICRMNLDVLQQESRMQLSEADRDLHKGFRATALADEIAKYRKDLLANNFQPYEKTLGVRLDTTRFQAPSRETRFYREAMIQLLTGLISGHEDAQKAIESGEYIRFINDDITDYPDWMLPEVRKKAVKSAREDSSEKPTIRRRKIESRHRVCQSSWTETTRSRLGSKNREESNRNLGSKI